MPMTPRTVVSRMVMTRPSRSTSGPAKIRVSPSQVANAVKNSAATAAVCPWLFRTARVSQLFAEPSPSSTPSMTTPMSSSRQFSQPRSHWRSAAPARSGRRRPALGPARVLAARDARRHREGGRRDEHGLADELRRGADAERGAGRADPRPDGGPDGPGRVHARHEGAPGGPLDGGALDVDQHVEGADPCPGDHEGDRDKRDRVQR